MKQAYYMSILFLAIFNAVPYLLCAQVVNINNGLHVVAEGSISLVVENGGLKNDGIFYPDSSTVFFDGASTTAVSGSQPTTFYNLRFRGTGTKQNGGDISVLNTLGVEGSTIVDADGATNDKPFTLKSSDTATAYVDKLSNGDIIGNVTVERFINTGTNNGQHAKSWQFLATPTTGQSYFQSWQESGSTPAGYGTWVTGTGSGFDVTTALPSLKYYDNSTGNWVGITNTSASLQNKLGYMLFVRGDRTVTTSTGIPNNTNMRSKGVLFTAVNPPPSVPVAANKFQSFGNPYASRVEFDKIYQLSTGISNVFYVWDPKLNGTWNYGGYQTLSALTGYIPSAGSITTYYPAGVPSPFIESGQAAFVYGNNTGGNVNFNEDCKVGGSRLVNREQLMSYNTVPVNRRFLFTTLFTNTGMIADGNIVVFENGFGNEINELDAKKILNSGENLGLSRDGNLFAIEARNEISVNDTIFYYLQNLKPQAYQLRFSPKNLPPGISAILIDKFQNSNTAISSIDSSFVNFTVDAAAGSAAPDRFMLVFRLASVVPVKIIQVAATRNSEHTALVSWKVENEINLKQYDIERSANGKDFYTLGNTLPTANNGGGASYSFQDESILKGINYYRVKAINNDNKVDYSDIVKIDPENSFAGISIYPNPVRDKIIHTSFINQKKGKYSLSLSNKLGQVIYRNSIDITQSQVSITISPGKSLAAGTYQLSISGEDGTKITEQVIVK